MDLECAERWNWGTRENVFRTMKCLLSSTRRATLLLLVLAMIGACAASPGAPTPAGFVRERVGPLTVTHPASWHLVAGPPAVPDRPVPLAYLSNVALTVGACPTVTPDGAFGPCAPPIPRLPPDGVLVTIAPNLGFAEMIPPKIGTISPPDAACGGSGSDVEEWSAVAGAIVTACLRDPGVRSAEAEFHVLVDSIQGRLTFNRFKLARPAPSVPRTSP